MGMKTAAAKTEQVVRVHNAHRHNYRRGGKAHPLGTTDHPADAFTADQLAAVQADPRLSVSVVDKPADPPSAAAPAAGAPGA